jgi:hypothetical protein
MMKDSPPLPRHRKNGIYIKIHSRKDFLRKSVLLSKRSVTLQAELLNKEPMNFLFSHISKNPALSIFNGCGLVVCNHLLEREREREREMNLASRTRERKRNQLITQENLRLFSPAFRPILTNHITSREGWIVILSAEGAAYLFVL